MGIADEDCLKRAMHLMFQHLKVCPQCAPNDHPSPFTLHSHYCAFIARRGSILPARRCLDARRLASLATQALQVRGWECIAWLSIHSRVITDRVPCLQTRPSRAPHWRTPSSP